MEEWRGEGRGQGEGSEGEGGKGREEEGCTGGVEGTAYSSIPDPARLSPLV